MNKLDDLTQIKSLDKKKALDSIKQLPSQISQAWQESFVLNIPSEYKSVNNIVVSGMGGSTYGVRIIKSLYDGAEMSKVPIELSNGYWLPGYVNEKSLVILSSYSGTTEETLETAREAKEKKAKIIGITSGGPLEDFLKTNNYPSYFFNPLYNPSGQPRIGVGYMVSGLLGILAGLGYIPVEEKEISSIVSFLNTKTQTINENISSDKNPLKRLALKLTGKIPVMIVSDFLEGTSYSVRNPFHETAKQFALHFTIPELNHHLLEGLSFPDYLKKSLYFLFIESQIYDKRNLKRFCLTREVISKYQIPYETVTLTGNSALSQVFEMLQWGAWTTFYLAILHNIDPSDIPWVDYFKSQLKNEK